MKTLLALIIAFAFSLLFVSCIQIITDDEFLTYPVYYQTLAKKCRLNENEDCCLRSVKVMAKGSFDREARGGCGSQYEKNSLDCFGTYVWCELTGSGSLI